MNQVGLPTYHRIVKPELTDTEPVEWVWSRAVHANWITDELKEETSTC